MVDGPLFEGPAGAAVAEPFCALQAPDRAANLP